MKIVAVPVDDLVLSPELARSKGSKPFEDRLKASIEAIGLVEPIKVARQGDGRFLVVDGLMRVRAIQAIRSANPAAFPTVDAYVVDFDLRFELRYQTDIYQDLLPSQLAALVEHLHETTNIHKADIGRYIGVSPPTVRNYTGLWRLLQRGGLFARIVELMDVGVMPSSNPFVWLRLSDWGIRYVLEEIFADGGRAEQWIDERVSAARRGDVAVFPIKFVESATGGLTADCYREDEEVRSLKRSLGLRRAAPEPQAVPDMAPAVRHLGKVARRSSDPVLRVAARSLAGYLQ